MKDPGVALTSMLSNALGQATLIALAVGAVYYIASGLTLLLLITSL